MTSPNYSTCAIASLAALVTLMEMATAPAAIIQPMAGNSRGVAESIPGLDLTANFAVYDRRGGRLSDAFGTGLFGNWSGFDNYFISGQRGMGFDTSAKYLYLYQMRNDGPGTGDVSSFSVKTAPGSVTSFGQWDLSFYDNGGYLSNTNAFGADTAKHTPAAPANIGVTNPAIGGIYSDFIGGVPSLSSDGWFKVATSLKQGSTSRIFGFTSNIAPHLWVATLKGSPDNMACGTLPGPAVPEPTTITLFIAAVAGLFAVRHRQTQLPRRVNAGCDRNLSRKMDAARIGTQGLRDEVRPLPVARIYIESRRVAAAYGVGEPRQDVGRAVR